MKGKLDLERFAEIYLHGASLFAIVWLRGNVKELFRKLKSAGHLGEMEHHRLRSLLCAALFAAAYGPGWLIAGTWQITIISGSLLAPLFMKPFKQNRSRTDKRQIPYKGSRCRSSFNRGGADAS
ncbi:multidrug resistance efflux transporter family protein [Bacillus licheniformis]|nr:multidrug resistance efflux transporter family protein [Bacillus licheniformis]